MGSLPEVVSRSRRSCRHGVGALVGLVLLLGALDLHDPGLRPSVYATPTPVLPGAESEHLEAGCLLSPDHQPATWPGGKERLAISRVRYPAPPPAVDRSPAPYAPAMPGRASVRSDCTRSPPVR